MGLFKLAPRDILGAARLQVWQDHPYFMELLFKLRPVERPDMTGGMGVDDGLRLYFDPAFVEKLGVKHTKTLLSHECQHVLREHHRRGDALQRSESRGS